MNNTLIIFDWDDTLFPTSWILSNGIEVRNIVSIRRYIVYFNELDNLVHKLLSTTLLIGKVVIVTNANINWIGITKHTLPKTSELIEKYIPIISARDLYNGVCDMNKWKIYAFNNNMNNVITWANQVISIGDAEYEYNALISLNPRIDVGKKLKAIRLVKNPSFDIVIDQLEVITKAMPDICNRKDHLDLKIMTK